MAPAPFPISWLRFGGVSLDDHFFFLMGIFPFVGLSRGFVSVLLSGPSSSGSYVYGLNGNRILPFLVRFALAFFLPGRCRHRPSTL